MATSYRTEFPDFDPTTLPAIPSTWEDISWRNDSCPSFMVAELANGTDEWRNLMVYVDFADAAQREHPETPRFSVLETGAHLALEGTKELFSSDDWEAVLRFIGTTDYAAKPETVTTDLGHGWYANQHADGSMTIRNCDLGLRSELPRESVETLRRIIKG